MAEIKFNFYNTYINYYRNIKDINKYNIYIRPYYEFLNSSFYDMETLSKFYRIEFIGYILYELSILRKVEYKVYESLKYINRQKIFSKSIFKIGKFNYKIYNLLRY